MKIDITDKLSFDANPSLVIRGEEYEVNADAPTMLKVLALIGDGDNMSPDDLMSTYELIFPKKTRDRLDRLKLNFRDFQEVIKGAVALVTDTGDPSGEQ